MDNIVQDFSNFVKHLFDGKVRADGKTPYFNHLENVRKNTAFLIGEWTSFQLIALAS